MKIRNQKRKDFSNTMKLKRILAVIGVILLAGLYISTLVFAIIGTPFAISMLKASVFATIFIPILLYVFNMVVKHLKGDSAEKKDEP